MDPYRRRALILAFGVTYVSAQILSVFAANFRGDKKFGFRMFSQSSAFEAHLFRELRDGTLQETPGGRWEVPAAGGERLRYEWRQWVRDNRLDRLDRWTPARTGIEVTLKYFQMALDYVALHIPEDRTTRRLVMKIEYGKAGEETKRVVLYSVPRPLPDDGGGSR